MVLATVFQHVLRTLFRLLTREAPAYDAAAVEAAKLKKAAKTPAAALPPLSLG